MSRVTLRVWSFVVGAGLMAATPAAAQQTVNLTIGGFVPQSADRRVPGDVLNTNATFLAFDFEEFTGATLGAEWLVPIGRYLEAGAGIGFFRRTVPSVYADFVDPDGTEIDSDLYLRIVPVSFTVRVTPLGQSSAVQPYVGVGLGVFRWRYREAGEFVDFGGGGRTIFTDEFTADGTATGRVVLGGIRFGSRGATAGFEVRHQRAEGELDSRFAGPRIDLGGWTYQLTVGARF